MQDLVEAQQTTPATDDRAIGDTLPCSLVNNLAKNTEEQCKFILDNDCLEDEATVDYVYLVFCKIDYEMRLLAITLVIFLVIVLFLNLSAVADEFLCPSLLTVAKSLRMSDSLAGVTLLAFGNGCPDIFSSLAAASSGRPELIVGELLGAGIFCTSIVAGLIFITTEFKIARRPLLRDTSFYLLAVYLIWLFCSQGQVTFYGALAFIIIYVIYLLTALVGQAVHSRLRGEYPIAERGEASEKTGHVSGEADATGSTEKGVIYRRLEELIRRRSSGLVEFKPSDCKRNEEERRASTGAQSDTVTTIQVSATFDKCPPKDRQNEQDWSSSNNYINVIEIGKHQLECKPKGEHDTRNVPTTTSPASPTCEKKAPAQPEILISTHVETPATDRFNLDEFDQFLAQINPVDTTNWAQLSLLTKIMALIRSPILLLTTLTVPVNDGDKPNGNWCRLLNSIHCFTIPIGVVSLTRLEGPSSWSWWFSTTAQLDDELLKMATANSGNASLIGGGSNTEQDFGDVLITCSKFMVFLPGLLLALYVFNTTSATRPPRYHSLFAYLGFIMSILWIYKLANEIICLLKTIGIIFSMSDTAIGLGFLAWGNSLGDIVANLTLAQVGHARMALGASIGAPLLNLLLGFGLSFTISLKPGEATEIDYNDTMTLLAGTLALILILLMASTFLAQNRSKKPFGYLLISCYIIYFFLAVCLECDFL